MKMKPLRTWLQDIRLAQEKTHQQVADEVNIERAYYTMIENGERRPSPEVAKRIALVLDFESYGFDWTKFYDDELAASKESA